MLSGNPFSGFADSLNTKVAAVQTAVDGALSAANTLKSLPFIGQQLGVLDKVQNFIDTAGTKIKSELDSFSMAGVQVSDLQNELFKVLGNTGGLNLVGDTNNDGSINAQDIEVSNFVTNSSGVLTSASVEILIHQSLAADTGAAPSFNLGLPALPFSITTKGGLSVMAGFDYDLSMTYASGSISLNSPTLNHLNSSLPAHQLAFSVTAGFLANTSLTADVGFLHGTLAPTGSPQQNQLSLQIDVDNLTLNGAPTAAFNGSANVNLMATLGLSNGNFPSISTDISMNWSDLTNASTLAFAYGNVQLNLGDFLSNLVKPILADIQQYAKPFQGAINVLNAPIPGIDSLPGLSNFSLMTLAGGIAGATGYGPLEGLVAEALHLVTLADSFTLGPDVTFPFGDFGLNGSMIASAPAALDPTALISNLNQSLTNLNTSDLTSAAQSVISSFASQLPGKIAGLGLGSAATSCLDALAQAVTGGGGSSVNIDFPLFDNPGSILNLLFGQDVDLVAFTAALSIPPTGFSFPSVSIPFLGVFSAGVSFNASIDVDASLKIGYDTYGLRELVAQLQNGTPSAGTIATDIGDGFYIQGPQGSNLGSHFSISGSIGLQFAISVNVGVAGASIGPEAGLTTPNGPISVSLNDAYPDSTHDGKIRLSEIGQEIANGDLFNVSGDLQAGLTIVASGYVGFPPTFGFTFNKVIDSIATVTLYDSSSANSSVVSAVPPKVSSISPATGTTAGGTTVTIYGANLDNATEVDFGGVAGTIVDDEPTFIVVTTPGGNVAVPRDVTVTTPNGTGTDPSAFTYVAPPAISAIGPPAEGPVAGGQLVTIFGAFLGNATEVDFGSASAAIVSNSGLEITAYAPPGSGTVDVRVTTAGGESAIPSGGSGDSDQYTYVPPPVITSISPPGGPLLGGGIITIDGDNFGDPGTVMGDATKVTFGYGPTAPTVPVLTQTYIPGPFSHWELTARVPKTTTSGWTYVTVTTTSGGTSGIIEVTPSNPNPADIYTYAAIPSITSLSSGAGLLTDPTPITIYGGDFGGATSVQFGSTAIPSTNFRVTVLSASQDEWELNVTPPSATSASTVNLTVTTPGGTSNSVPFTYTLLPLVTNVSPSAGPMGGGIPVTITGVNLENVTELSFGPFDTQGTIFSSAGFISKSATQIVVTLPSRLPSAPATVDVLVETPDSFSQASATDHFTYTTAPIVNGLSPKSGPYEGGTAVTITGTSLANATKVDFGTTAATIISDTATQIVAVSPAGALGLTDVTVTTAGGTSGTSANDKFNYALFLPEIDQQVSPATGPTTGGTSVTIVGQYFLGTTAVDFDDTLHGPIPATSFTVVSSTEIIAVSPPHAAGGVAITILTPPNERSIYSYPDQFVYTTTSSVTGVSPAVGLIAGGTTVTITGANLAGATAVDFGGVAGTIVPGTDSGTQIEATSPAGSAGTVDVTVVTPTGPTAASPADHFTYQIPGPVVSTVSPNSGPPAGGTSVTITGSNLTGATAVKFGGIPATSFTVNANGTITATSPAGASGAVDVTVVTPGGASVVSPQDQFDYGDLPSVSSLFFSLGPANQNGSGYLGQMIFGLNLTGATDVLYGPIDIPISASDIHDGGNGTTEIGFFSPPVEGPGTVDVRVLTPNGETPITANDRFTYTAAPTFIPGEGGNGAGPVAGGGEVTLYVWNMENATAVNFGGTPAASFTENSDGVDSTITAVSPPGAPGLVSVTVTSPQGTASLDNAFRYFAIPTVSGISPASGGISGGNTVLISGTGLDNGATEVDFGGVPATSFGSSGGNLLVEAPPGASLGTVDVTVVTYGGTSAISSADQYTYMPPPTVTAITSPASASGALEGGTEVTITGTGLANATEVDFGPNPFSSYNFYTRATIVSDSDGQIVAISPPGYYGYGPVDVTVTTANGTTANSSADQFTYTHAPFITDVGLQNGNGTLPPQGPVAGGSTVRIDGYDLDGATAVNFGQTAATIVADSPNEIDVTAPPGTAGAVDITVTTPNGTTDISTADQFTYFAMPIVSGISPSSGSVLGGTQVLINGTGLAGATQVNFGQVVAAIVGDSDGQIVVTAPPLFNSSTPDVTVTTPGGTSAISSADVFTYMNPPYVNDVEPPSGPVQGGTLVTITGPFLTGAQSVLFGANPGTIISNTDSQIVVLSPEATADAAGTVDVTVVTQYGTSPIATYDQFTYALPPAVTGIDQTSGSAAGGTTMTISGANLSGATAVDFGGVPALSFTVNFDGTITAVSPGGDVSTVDVTVVTPGGTTATSPADQFTYVAVPSVSAIGPFSGPIAGGTQVTIVGTDLGGATQVDFNDGQGDDFVGTIVSDSSGQIVVTSPNFGFLATVDVTVTTIGGTSATSAADQFNFVAAPSVSSISPSFGFRSGGDLVTIKGTNLDNATAVNFGQNAGTIVDETATQIDVISPAGAAGTVDVTVVTPGGTSAPSLQDKYTYIVPAPFVLGVSPSVGPETGGTKVTITGTDLDAATEVDFNDVVGDIFVGTIVSDTATQIVVTSPAGSLGTVDVTVTTLAGTSEFSQADQFTYITAPAVSAIDSSVGPAAGGTEVFIYGTNLDGATAVNFGPNAATIVDDAATYIVAISPAGTAGKVDLTVTTQYGTSAISSADQFTYLGPPTAAPDSYSTVEDSTLTVAAPGVLANDTGPQGYPLTAVQLTDPIHGTLSFGSDGSFSYTPDSGYVGPDSFTYQTSDGIESSAAATVSLSVGLATLTWTGTSSGDWTDPQWSGLGSPYPDSTTNAIVDTAVSAVQVTSNQAANGLAISNGGQVAVGPGASLSVTTDTSVTAGGALNVDPNGVFSTGGTLTLDTGGSLTGGSVAAAAFQLDDGAASSNLSGPGGLTKNTNGTVTLSGTNSYEGGTAIEGGTLIVANSAALPQGSNLAIGPNGAGELASGVNQIVGGIDGMGSLQVDSGSSLTASHITLGALVIGGMADAPAMVTIAASAASGSPLSAEGGSGLGAGGSGRSAPASDGVTAASALSAASASNVVSSSSDASVSDVAMGEAIIPARLAALRIRQLAQVAASNALLAGGTSATAEPHLAAAGQFTPNRAPTTKPTALPYLTDALFGESAMVAASRSTTVATNWAPPTRPPRSAYVATSALTTGFAIADSNAHGRTALSSRAIDAALAETDFARALDDSLLELLAGAVHWHR